MYQTNLSLRIDSFESCHWKIVFINNFLKNHPDDKCNLDEISWSACKLFTLRKSKSWTYATFVGYKTPSNPNDRIKTEINGGIITSGILE